MESFDMAVRNGLVVTSGSRFRADIGIQNGKIVQLGGSFAAEVEIDANGKYVLPGGIDMHVHLTPVQLPDEEIRWVDDFQSGTKAAAAGGITTIGNITFPQQDEGLLQALKRTAAEAEPHALIDYVLHPVILDPTPECLVEVPRLAREDHTSIKIFMMLSNFDTQVSAYLQAMQLAGENGMLTMIHCEDASLINYLGQRLITQGKKGASYYPTSRPVFVEDVSVSRAVALAEATGASLYVVHLSSAAALATCRKARARGIPVFVEIRPIYLYLTAERFSEPDGAKYVGNPPLREESDIQALWKGLWSRDVHTLCTDHAPWMLSEKLDPDRDITNFRPGISELETLLPMFYSEGVRTRRITLENFVELTSTNAAKLFGLYPQKGTISVGADADLALWDLKKTVSIDSSRFHSKSDFSPYQGWQVTGWPVMTISRGEVVYHEGKITTKPGHGVLLKRGSHQQL